MSDQPVPWDLPPGAPVEPAAAQPFTAPPPPPPGVIPYVDFHLGPRRGLTMHLTTGNSMIQGKIPPVVSIDGRQYVVNWGAIVFEIPADRSVHVSVHVEGNRMAQFASALLPPSPGAMSLTYTTHYMSGVGTLR